MACLDVLNSDNYLNLNITLLRLFGFQTAAYWAELSRVLGRVKDKKKFNESGYFKLDRKYIEKKTTLNIEEQIKCDQVLAEAGVLAVDSENPDIISVDMQMVLSLIINGDVDAISEKAKKITTKVVPKEKAAAKKAGMKSTMRKYVIEADEELFEAYGRWIDVMVDNRRVNKVTVETFQKTVQDFSKEKSVQLEVIDLATSHTYLDAHWAISIYNNLHKSNPTTLAPQKVGTTINRNIQF